MPSRISISRACLIRHAFRASSTARLMLRTATGPFSAIRSAIALRLRQRLAVRDDATDQAHLEAFARAVVVSRSAALPSPAVNGICRGRRVVEPPCGNRPQRTSETPKLRALAGHADVGSLKDLDAAGDADALDRGDERLHGAVLRSSPRKISW